MPILDDPQMSVKLGTLQSLDDAIAFRSGRLQRPCLDCTPRRRCAEHAFDQYLLQAYTARYAAAQADALADMDPAGIGKLTQAGGMPLTAATVRAAVTARLREVAASSPDVVGLDREPVVIEVGGRALGGHAPAARMKET